jgi:hypothetical protein
MDTLKKIGGFLLSIVILCLPVGIVYVWMEVSKRLNRPSSINETINRNEHVIAILRNEKTGKKEIIYA